MVYWPIRVRSYFSDDINFIKKKTLSLLDFWEKPDTFAKEKPASSG